MDVSDRHEPAGQRLFIYTCARAHRVVVRFVGELDLVDADRARTALTVDQAATVVLDLTDLRFVDAAGVAAIVDAQRALRGAGHRLQLRGAQGVVRRVLEITDLAYLLHG